MTALVIDGNSLVYRVYYASYKQLELYKSENKTPLNAVKLFLLIILKIVHQKQYDYMLIAFDAKKKTNRHDTYKEYKGERKPMPEDLVVQLPIINKIMDQLKINYTKIDGFEADDIIGSYAKIMNEQKINVEIFSSDKDMLQLVNDLTVVTLFKTGISDTVTVNPQNFGEIFHGLTPKNVTDFKGISGDASDNLNGVKGIGPKTAAELILKYGSLEGIYEHIDELSESQKAKFIASKEHAVMCKALSTINCDVLDSINWETYRFQPIDKNVLMTIIQTYHFHGFDKYL
ncbi:MAG: 5'-3' exonuclease [Mycoplasmataceae bacterium]|jgi:DNA polymerase-1|nr:5'-3' exonuclease [Mycoplasmataceae bacterium]